MAATTIGDINFGAEAETGLFIESANFDYSVQEKWIADEDGDAVAGALFKPEMTFSLEGAFKTTGTPTWDLGSSLVIANIPNHADFIPSYSAGGRYAITSANVTKGNESEERRNIGGVFKPFIV